MSNQKVEEPKETSEERDRKAKQRIAEIEKREAINFPKLNYKWYELSNKITIEVYVKDLQNGEISAEIDADDKSVLYITVKGEKHKFDLYGVIENPVVTVKKTKAEVTFTSVGVPSHFPVLLKCEGRINSIKQQKYAELDKIGEKDKKEGLNDFFQNIFNQGTDEQKMAMKKSMQESGGTVLSTNWSEVGSKKVEPQRGDK